MQSDCLARLRKGKQFCKHCEFRNTKDCELNIPTIEGLHTHGELQNTIEILLRLNIPMLWIGSHGIGKTQIIRQVTSTLKWRMLEVNLPYKERVDLTGRMEPSEDHKHTVYLPPKWFPIKDDPEYAQHTVINFDELNRAPNDILRAVLPLILEGVVNERRLPSIYRRVAAINPWDADYNVYDLEPALLDRVCFLTDIPRDLDWLTWSKGRMSDAVQAVAKKSWGMFDWQQTVSMDKKPTQRGLATFDKFVSFVSMNIYLAHGLKIAVGLLGTPGVAIYENVKKELKDEQIEYPLTGTQVLQNVKKYAGRISSWSKGTVRGDLLNATMLNVATTMKEIELKSTAKESARSMTNNLIEFMLLIPKDFIISFIEHIQDLTEWMNGLGETKNEKIDKLLFDHKTN